MTVRRSPDATIGRNTVLKLNKEEKTVPIAHSKW